MKKILFLLLVCLIKLSAFEYLIAEYKQSNPAPNSSIQILYIDKNENLMIKRIYPNGSVNYGLFNTDNNRFIQLSRIKFQDQPVYKYINNETFQNYYKNDLLFLDLLYKSGDAFLNYLYNDKSFTISNYIKYENYELLYNEDGQIIESLVNGNWAGLYDGPDNSGYLYNEKGDLLYKNGVPVSFLEKLNDKLLKKFKINLESIFIKKIFYPLLVLIFACVIFRSVIRMAFKAFLIRFYDKKIGQLEKRREKIENA